MSDFYTPNLLFRQNAVRHSPRASPNSSSTSVNIPAPAAWLYEPENPKDMEIMNKSCSLNRLNIKSNYWKIPDCNMNLTSMDIRKSLNDVHDPVLAISSGNKQANLFIYSLDLDENYLTHNNTISLPNIHSMKWVPEQENDSSLHLVTGNSGGSAHLVSIPNPENVEENAEIIKKFNHKKYLKAHTPANISKLNFLNNTELLSLYQGNLFRWDVSSARSKPLQISTIPGIRNFDIIPSNQTTIAISGDFGVSLFDTRQSEFRIPSSYAGKHISHKQIRSNIIKWSSYDENVFASSHLDGVVRLWDVRKQEFFGQLDGHNKKLVTTMEWNNEDLFTGGKDGNIIHWDLSNTNDNLLNCTLKEGLNSINFNPSKNALETKVNQRQCGTILPASNTNITSLASISGTREEDCKVLSIDGSSFFGVHSKIYDAINVNINSEKLYYTSSDLSLLLNSEPTSEKSSNETLVEHGVEEEGAEEDYEAEFRSSKAGSIAMTDSDSVIEVTQPLAISRKPTIIQTSLSRKQSLIEQDSQNEPFRPLSRKPTLLPANENMSNDTLFEHEDGQEHDDLFSDMDIATEDEISFSENRSSSVNENRFTFISRNSVGSSPNSDGFSDNDSLSTNPTIVEDNHSLFEKNEPFEINFEAERLAT